MRPSVFFVTGSFLFCASLLACSSSSSPDDESGATGGSGTGTGGSPSGGATTGGTTSGGAASGGSSSSTGGTSATSGGAASGGVSSGGATGTGGASGGDGGQGTGGTTTGGGCESADLLCETFESFELGTVPQNDTWTGVAGECESGPFELGVSDEQAADGTKSLKATNSAWAQCRVAGSFGQADDFWVTAQLYIDSAMDLSEKEVMALDLAPSDQLTTDGASIRFGSRTKAPCTESPGPQVTLFNVGGGEQTGCSGEVEYPQGRWFCFEAHVNQTGPTDVRTYIDGTAVTYLASGWAEPKESISTGEETNVVKMNHVRLGLFSNTTAQGDAYIDALSVSTTRVGCP